MTNRPARRSALLDGALLLAVALTVDVVATLGWAALSGAPPLSLATSALASVASGWAMWLVLAALVVLLAVVVPSRRARLGLAIPAAVVAWIAGQSLLSALAGTPFPASLLWGIFRLPLFVASVAVAALVVAAIGRRSPLGVVRAVALGGALLLTLSFPWQWFRVYFTLFGAQREASPKDAAVYLGTFLAALALAVLAVVLAALERRRGAIAGAVAVLLVALFVGFACQVPSGTVWIRPGEPVERPLPPCYTDRDKSACGG